MEVWTDKVRKILDGIPTQALPLSRVMSALGEMKVSEVGGAGRFLQGILDQPETFKVIPDRLGPWMRGSDPRSGQPTSRGPLPLLSDPWILTCSPSSASADSDGRAVGRVGESLQAWGREIDDGSQVAVARWIEANGEVERVFQKLFRGDGDGDEKPRSTSPLPYPLPDGSVLRPGPQPGYPRAVRPGSH